MAFHIQVAPPAVKRHCAALRPEFSMVLKHLSNLEPVSSPLKTDKSLSTLLNLQSNGPGSPSALTSVETWACPIENKGPNSGLRSDSDLTYPTAILKLLY